MSYPYCPPRRPDEKSLCALVRALLESGVTPEALRDALRATALAPRRADNGPPPDWDSYVVNPSPLFGSIANLFLKRRRASGALLADVIKNGT
jgi:hypothetical protein